MDTEFDGTARLFSENVQAVDRLLDFGNAIIDVAVGGLRKLEADLEERQFNNAVILVRNRARLLSNVKDGDSLRPQYQAMFNQCVVLLVSYFGSALHTLFRQGVAAALRSGADLPAAKHELKVSWRSALQEGEDPAETFADLLIAQKDISFQDMQSIRRAFKGHLEIELKRSSDTDNIILGQAARHLIAHSSGIIDDRMLRQVSGQTSRTLKLQLTAGLPIQFEPGEVRILAESMKAYVNTVAAHLNIAFQQWSKEAD